MVYATFAIWCTDLEVKIEVLETYDFGFCQYRSLIITVTIKCSETKKLPVLMAAVNGVMLYVYFSLNSVNCGWGNGAIE